MISIHVLRVEDDVTDWVTVDTTTIFQSTSSVWRTTSRSAPFFRSAAISIHVLRVEDDLEFVVCANNMRLFQSTSSVWRTTTEVERCETWRMEKFQSTSSVWRTTQEF